MAAGVTSSLIGRIVDIGRMRAPADPGHFRDLLNIQIGHATYRMG
jgi:hypothetical protein